MVPKLIVEYSFRSCKATCQSSTGEFSFKSTGLQLQQITFSPEKLFTDMVDGGVCFRRYGTWVARNPVLVLCSSIGIVLVLCLGLIRFQVETRPEKVK